MRHVTFMAAAGIAVAWLLGGCASGPAPAADFPPGARTPAAAEVSSLLKGKSFNLAGVGIRTDYASESDVVTAYFSGRSEPGKWRTEDGRICFDFKTIPSACNDLRVVGNDIYLKRSNGQVVMLEPRR